MMSDIGESRSNNQRRTQKSKAIQRRRKMTQAIRRESQGNLEVEEIVLSCITRLKHEHEDQAFLAGPR